MLRALTKNWWMLVLRGAVLILFSVLCFINPGLTAVSLAVWFGAMLCVNGGFTLIGAFMSWKEEADRWLILADGAITLILGLLILRAPQVTLLFISLTFAFWFIFTGIARIATGIALRKELKGEGWMILGGAFSVIFGFILFGQPGLSLASLLIFIGVFALVGGLFFVIVGLKVRKGDKWLSEHSIQ